MNIYIETVNIYINEAAFLPIILILVFPKLRQLVTVKVGKIDKISNVR